MNHFSKPLTFFYLHLPPTMTQQELLDQLEQELRGVLETARTQIAPLSDSALRQRPSAPKAWNALECIEHLNLHYNDYISQIELAIHKAKAHKFVAVPQEPVRYNWLGKTAVNRVRSSKPKGFKAEKRYNPLGRELGPHVVKSYIINCEKLVRILQLSREVDLNKARIRFAPFSLLKYQLGNLLEFMVAHNQRHLAQAIRASGSTAA